MANLQEPGTITRGSAKAPPRAERPEAEPPTAQLELSEYEAALASTTKLMQDLGWEMIQFTQGSFDRSVRAMGEMMGDVVRLQNDYMTGMADQWVDQSGRMAELYGRISAQMSELTRRGQPS